MAQNKTEEILPPIYKTPPSRHKKLRRREVDESVSHSKINRGNVKRKCTYANSLVTIIEDAKINQ